jgi:hypothetical protein
VKIRHYTEGTSIVAGRCRVTPLPLLTRKTSALGPGCVKTLDGLSV